MFKKILCCLLFMYASFIKADGPPVDKYAHFGVAYAANTIAYALIKPSFCMKNELCAHIMAAMIVGTASMWWEMDSGVVDYNDLKADAFGIGASILTIRLIEYRVEF